MTGNETGDAAVLMDSRECMLLTLEEMWFLLYDCPLDDEKNGLGEEDIDFLITTVQQWAAEL